MRWPIVIVLGTATNAFAQPPDPQPEPPPSADADTPVPAQPAPPQPAPPQAPPTSAPITTIPPDVQRTLDTLSTHVNDLNAWKRQTEDALPEEQPSVGNYITVFLDVGAFVVGGDGTGIRSDLYHNNYGKYRNTIAGQWVFMGDPFSTAINSFGEPADTGLSREVDQDTINSTGRFSFLVNAVGLDFTKAVVPGVAVAALVEFLPRPGTDAIDVEFAHVDYWPVDGVELILQAGKIDSVLGIEYRSQDALRRTEVTPSLICRYTCGRPVGIGARFSRGGLSTSASVTNGDNFEERFEPDDELKANRLPTAAGHVQWKFSMGPKQAQSLELGVSSAFGPQDGQSTLRVHQWHYGLDARLILKNWDVTAEFVQGKQQGSTTGDPANDRTLGIERPACDVAACLHYKGAYVLVDHAMTSWLTPYLRFDWRDAVHRSGADFVYESHTVRSTIGLHMTMTSRIVAKVEYTWNHELGVPDFPHDVLTSSVVVATD